MELAVGEVVDGGDAADHAAAALGEVVLDLGVPVEGVLLLREQRGHVNAQRGDPEGVAPVQAVRELDEAVEIGLRADRPGGHPAQENTPSSRPIFANASSAKST